MQETNGNPMTGAEHREMAEELLERVARGFGDGSYSADLIAMAQVHATLAKGMPDVFELIATIKDLCGGSTCPNCQRAYAHVDGLLAARFEDGS